MGLLREDTWPIEEKVPGETTGKPDSRLEICVNGARLRKKTHRRKVITAPLKGDDPFFKTTNREVGEKLQVLYPSFYSAPSD